MSVQRIPDRIRKHRGDTEWLEVNGRAARDEYIAQHDEQDRLHARQAFSSVMFTDPRTGVLYGRAPQWFRQEFRASFEEFKRGLAEIDPIFKNAWGGPRRTADGESKAVTVIETRRR